MARSVDGVASEDAKQRVAARFVDWLAIRVEAEATGALDSTMDTRPDGRFWLGRLAPEREIQARDIGDRAERLEPCAVGLRVLPRAGLVEFPVRGRARFVVWSLHGGDWNKSVPIVADFAASISLDVPSSQRLPDVFAQTLKDAAISPVIDAAIEIQSSRIRDGRLEVTATLVNVSDSDHADASDNARGRLFECALELFDPPTDDFLLATLPDSFRYDRRVPAWGVNAGMEVTERGLATRDMPITERKRPIFWNVDGPEPDLSFDTLAKNPIPQLRALVDAHLEWGRHAWNVDALAERFEGASREAGIAELEREREGFDEEARRLAAGVAALDSDLDLLWSFQLMNEAMSLSARGRYDRWRPFQIGFMLANVVSCRGEERDTVDIVWFATGGGKTETYLGLILTAAFLDRLRGKTTGITAWSRFPLRLLSLQQTQRFANALAAGETVRRRHDIEGDPFGLGFLIGDSATPNRIPVDGGKNSRWDPDDAAMPDGLRRLKECPFCREDSIEMRFRRSVWRLEHNCTNERCEWGPGTPLPIHIVDEDIWRNLPTVIVGTLDKAAGIAMQAAMKGMIGAPSGVCSEPGHGHVYAKRSARPEGCLVPDCKASKNPLPMAPELYGMTFRLQDELHLLRDSLGAVDAHYEALLDDLQESLCGAKPKILASSATLAGYQRQSEILYRREARVFPHPEPKVGDGFWAGDTDRVMRRYLAVAPRGQTIEYALDRMIVSLQSAVRELIDRPAEVANEIGVSPSDLPFLIDLYGTNVVYGNTLRDLDAVVRSGNTQWGNIPSPRPNVEELTGRTQFDDVAQTLERLEKPEADFADRLHVVAASSMMSHGVDVDRLNVMVMAGLPLTTAEFIQATARVGRRWPAVAFVVHKMARERDASVYRAFPKYVTQGDRFVEPIPVTRRSRRVLERTVPGLAFARLLMLHERPGMKTVFKAYGLKDYLSRTPNFGRDEARAVCEMLGYDDSASDGLKREVERWYEDWIERIEDPANTNEWTSELGVPPMKPMISLRDVAESVEVWGRDSA